MKHQGKKNIEYHIPNERKSERELKKDHLQSL